MTTLINYIVFTAKKMQFTLFMIHVNQPLQSLLLSPVALFTVVCVLVGTAGTPPGRYMVEDPVGGTIGAGSWTAN